MKKFDEAFLGGFHRFSEWSYRKRSIDNYAFGTVFFVAAVAASVMIAVILFRASADYPVSVMTPVRMPVSVSEAILLAGVSLIALIFRRMLRDALQLRYDLGKYGLVDIASMAVRWILIGIYILSVVFGEAWWKMSDMLFLGIGLTFFSCPPPDMDLRLRKSLLD